MYIKLERISSPGKAFIVRNNIRQIAQNNMVITQAELESLEVLEGTVLYSVDETELITVEAKIQPVVPAVPSTTKVIKSCRTK